MDRAEFQSSYDDLAKRQRQVLHALLQGNDTEDIAKEYGIQPTTVRKHIERIYAKFGITALPGQPFSQRSQLLELGRAYLPDLVAPALKASPYIQQAIKNEPRRLDAMPNQPMFSSQSESTASIPTVDSAPILKRPAIEQEIVRKFMDSSLVLRIKAPSFMRQTLNLDQVIDQISQQGQYRPIKVDFSNLNEDTLKRVPYEDFIQAFCDMMTLTIEDDVKVSTAWNPLFVPNYSATIIFQRILSVIETPIVLILDHLDNIFAYSEKAEDFCKLLRQWHESSKSSDLWKRLRLILVHSVENYPRLDIHNSPLSGVMNVYELPEISKIEAQEALASQYTLSSETDIQHIEADIERIVNLAGGNPELLNVIFQELQVSQKSCSSLCEQLKVEVSKLPALIRDYLDGLYRQIHDNRFVSEQQSEDLTKALNKVFAAPSPIELGHDYKSGQFYVSRKLQNLGIIRQRADSRVEMYCDLFTKYFNNRLSS